MKVTKKIKKNIKRNSIKIFEVTRSEFYSREVNLLVVLGGVNIFIPVTGKSKSRSRA